MDQRTCIKFCVKNEIKCADAFQMLTVAYGEATLDRSNVYRWYKMFSEGREDVNDEERAGRPSTSTTDEKINEVEKMILANRRITVKEVAEDLNILIGSCHSIFINDLGMRLVDTKFVPKLLNCDQKQHRINIANEMLDSVRDDPNLPQRVITDDEAWVYGYDVETKAQSSQWKLPHEPRPKKAHQVRSNVKVSLTVFFDCRGEVHHEFLPQGRKVNKEYYLQVMRNLREAIRQKRRDLWKNKNWLLHHDNAPAHISLLVRDFLAKNNTLMMPQPPYSPDLAPCDFFLFPKLKRPMKRQCYATLDEIKTASKEELKKILKKDFLKCFEDWKNCWHKCTKQDLWERLLLIIKQFEEHGLVEIVYFWHKGIRNNNYTLILELEFKVTIPLKRLTEVTEMSRVKLNVLVRCTWDPSRTDSRLEGRGGVFLFLGLLLEKDFPDLPLEQHSSMFSNLLVFSRSLRYSLHHTDEDQQPETQTLDLLKLAFGNENVNKPTTFRWFSQFKNGMESVKDEKRVGRPILHRNPEKVSQISNLIKENPQIGLRNIEEETGKSKSLVGSIIKEDLQLKKTPSKIVPKMLTIQQKENHIEVAKKCLKWWKKTLIGRKK
ncbi:hypothetical protein LAZ67_6002340 [Cordylochernes scorpioides]|uniref:Mos1 transposase HTH domain-containing protein n=1 Tax=Cordylochernes scorpioides TaxID=51811 RepID=A0ABY6KJQ9_9ARAC|nr:hypothetical protein LAZ67_6002340 [Cordylochernes scorpioides]